MRQALLGLLFLAAATPAAVGAPASLSGTLVNVATYVTGDNSATTLNMGAVMGNGASAGMMGSGQGSMMNGYGSSGGYGMYGCRSAVGLLTSRGDLYLLVLDGSTSNVFSLCRELGGRVTIRGEIFQKSGLRAIRVDSVEAQ